MSKSIYKSKLNKNTSFSGELDVDKDYGFEEAIEKKVKAFERQHSSKEIMELVEKLGYLDLRDFVAVNKYVLDAKNHKEYINQTKAHLLSIALEMMNKNKNQLLKENFRKIDSENLNTSEKNEKKVEFLLENISDAKEFFYKNYYKIKEKNQRETLLVLNDFDKYDKMIESYVKREENNDKILYGDKIKKNGLTDYMDVIIDSYREERSFRFDLEAEDIYKKIEDLKSLNPKYQENEITELSNEITSLIKFYAFFKKFKRIYKPTDTKTESLIVYFTFYLFYS